MVVACELLCLPGNPGVATRVWEQFEAYLVSS